MKKAFWLSSFRIIAFALFIFGASCKKDALVTTGVQPSEDNLSATRVDTLTVVANSYKRDSIRTDGVTQGVFGYISDSYFGSSTASFVTQFKPSGSALNIIDINDIVIDSVVFSMQPKTCKGNINSAFSFSLYQLNDDLNLIDNYYNTHQFDYSSTPIATAKYSSLDYDAVADLYQSIDFNIDSALGIELLKQANVFVDNATFWEMHKGFVVSPNVSEFSDNFMVLADIYNNKSKLTVYFKQSAGATTQETYSFIIDNICERVNLFDNDYSSGAVNTAFNSNDAGKENLYLKDMGGIGVNISFPYLQNLNLEANLVVNKAEIILPINTTLVSNYPSHTEIWLGAYSEDSVLFRTFDDQANELHFNGVRQGNEFVFNITRDIQNIFTQQNNGINRNFGYTLLSLSPEQNTNGTILWGTNPSSGSEKMKFVLTYSKVN